MRDDNVIKSFKGSHYFIIIAGGLLIRILASAISTGHPTDINCFMYWANMLYEGGFRAFYVSDTFTDYPAGYMYVLYFAGLIKNVFGIEYGSYAYSLLLKLPSILGDLLAGVFIYSIAKGRLKNQGQPRSFTPLQIAAMYVFNPLIIMISAVWGQVDAIHTIIIVISIYCLTEKKYLYGYLLFALSALIKPQAFMFTPIYVFAEVSRLIERYNLGSVISIIKALIESFLYVGACLALWAVMLMPFLTWPLSSVADGKVVLTPVLQQYVSTLASYPYCSVNAYNIYALFGLNWKPISAPFLFLNYEIWGYIALAGIVVVSIVLLVRSKSKWNYFYTAAFICASVFMFSVKMHERYNFPLFAMLLIAYVYNGNKKILYSYIGLSAAAFLNYFDALRLAFEGFDYSRIGATSRIFSVIWTAAYIFFVYTTVSGFRNRRERFSDVPVRGKTVREFIPKKPEQNSRLTRRDFILAAALTAVYALTAFINLGEGTAPESHWSPKYGEEAVFDFGEPVNNISVQLYNGARNDREFLIGYSEDGESFEYEYNDEIMVKYSSGAVFRWNTVRTGWQKDFRYMKITSNASDLMIMEAAFRGADGSLRLTALKEPANLSEGASALTDESSLVPDRETYMNSTYFDEIYHPRTAYEFLHGMKVYETTHPPLGKLIIAAGIKIFGMNPFGWRFAGTLTGVIMIPFIYLFARRLFKSSYIAFFTAFIFSFDFMHYVQTRLATIDSYIVLFVLLMYYYMYKYYSMSFYHEKLHKTLIPLFLSGLFMGMGVASKWPGVYAGIGLAVLFFLTLIKRYREHLYAKKHGIEGYEGFAKKTVITLACCIIFFVIIPAVIYICSYIPYYFHCKDLYPYREYVTLLREYPWLDRLLPDNTLGNFFAGILENQKSMLGYHGNLVATHGYASPWWSWPLNVLPIWYYSGDAGNGLRHGISAFGNPAVWWTGIVAVFYCIGKYITNRDERLLFIIAAYFTQLVPWMFVTRIVFIYHYFPCVPFLVLMVAYMFNDIYQIGEVRLPLINICVKGKVFCHALMVLTGLLFVLFYPVLSGIAVNADTARSVLRWLPGWVLI